MADAVAGWISEPLPILLSGLGVIFLTAAIIAVIAGAMQPRLKLQSRMAHLGLAGTGRGARGIRTRDPEQRRIQERLKELEAKGKQRRRKFQLRTSLARAGLEIGYRGYMAMSALAGIAVAVACLIAGYPMVIVIGAGILCAVAVPRLVLSVMIGRRMAAFTRAFPNAIDILVRGVRSGLPVTECLEIISREMPDPVSTEFRRLVEGQKMGITLEQMLTRALDRMPTAEFKFFAIVIQVQQQVGGSLADTLANLSHVLRERKKMRDKADAMAGEGKASAAIIGSIPFVLAAILSLINPEYMSPFFSSLVGKVLFYAGLVWMGLGILVMRRMINFRI